MSKPRFIPEGYNTITPYLIVNNATAAIEFYKKALGATLLFKMDGHHGKVAHAEMKIGNSIFMLADEHPERGYKSPTHYSGTPVGFMIYVEDVDHVASEATKNGMTVKSAVQTQFYGDRSGSFEDPFGHSWTIATHVEDVSPEELKKRSEKLHGDCC